MVAQSKLTVGTFFSGIDIPVRALRDLIGAENIKHLFAVETNNACRRVLEATLNPKTMLKDANDPNLLALLKKSKAHMDKPTMH